MRTDVAFANVRGKCRQKPAGRSSYNVGTVRHHTKVLTISYMYSEIKVADYSCSCQYKYNKVISLVISNDKKTQIVLNVFYFVILFSTLLLFISLIYGVSNQ